MAFLSIRNDLDLEKAMTAMIVTDTLEDAVGMLQSDGYQTTVEFLKSIRNGPQLRERYEKRRNELAPMLEGEFANDMLDTGRRAALATRLAVEKTIEMFEAGQVRDPSRVGRDLSQISSQMVEKRLSLQGRPTQIVEHRDVNEIVRALQGMGVLQVEAIDSTAEELGEPTMTDVDADA